jgi:hypothetical protein
MHRKRSKSSFALRATIESLPCEGGYLKMWTFTYGALLDLDEAKARWKRFIILLRQHPRAKQWSGVRVFEMHPGGHGLHIHMVTGEWWDVVTVRHLWERAGGGRVNVKPIPKDKAGYVAKYVAKAQEALDRTRIWAYIGPCRDLVTRIKDVMIQSNWTRIYRALATMRDTEGRLWSTLPYYIRKQAVENVQRMKHWNFGIAQCVEWT